MKPARAASPPVWLGFLILGVLNLVDGLLLAAFGAETIQSTVREQLGVSWSELSSTSPIFAQFVNTLVSIVGLLITGFSLFIIIVSITSYRRRHRWAWFAMWNPAVFYGLLTLIFVARSQTFTSDVLSLEFVIFMLIATVVFQLIGYPEFSRERTSGQRPHSTLPVGPSG